jgi:hypothetical protein
MPTKKVVLNYLLFQLGWFACVLGATNHLPWIASIFVFLVVIAQTHAAPQPKSEYLLLFVALIIGGLIDQVLLSNQFVGYQSNGWSTAIVPVWILALWVSFASTLNVSMRWIRDKKMVAFLFGFIGGPLAYMAAEKLDAVQIGPSIISYLALSLFWGFAMLALIELAKQFDGHAYA